MKISRADVFWNYGATFMRVASALVVLPLILKMLPKEEVGLWTVMIGLNSMIYLLDFGFFQTFSRAVTYVYSGAKELKREGFSPIEGEMELSYSLLKGVLLSMKRYYSAASSILLLLLFTGGVFYIDRLLEGYSGDRERALIAWFWYGVLLCYQFFTYYYDAALTGRGMIKRSRQIIVLSQTIHIVVSSILLIAGMGIISLVIGQSLATLLNRFLASRAFYDAKTRERLKNAESHDWRVILKTLFHTASQNGLASLSWIFTNRVLAILGALYIPLSFIAPYGISKQITDITITLSLVWFSTYYPKLTGEQIRERVGEVKRIFIKAQLIALSIFISSALFVITLGDSLLTFIGSNVPLLSRGLLLLLFVASLLEAITQLSTSYLMSRNQVPHYKAQSITAIASLLLLLFALNVSDEGVLMLILIPMLVQIAYQHWRWTSRVIKELKIVPRDYLNGIKSIYKSIPVFKDDSNNNKQNKHCK